MIAKSDGKYRPRQRAHSAGSSFRAAKSPVAPKMTSVNDAGCCTFGTKGDFESRNLASLDMAGTPDGLIGPFYWERAARRFIYFQVGNFDRVICFPCTRLPSIPRELPFRGWKRFIRMSEGRCDPCPPMSRVLSRTALSLPTLHYRKAPGSKS